MDVLCEERGSGKGCREDYPADDAGDCEGFEGGGGEGAEELWNGGGEREDVEGTDRHFDIFQDMNMYN